MQDNIKHISSEESAALPEGIKLKTLKEAKPGTWYDGWTPYCTQQFCRTNPRMINKPYGFKCPDCGNMIGFNLLRLTDSPLNNKR